MSTQATKNLISKSMDGVWWGSGANASGLSRQEMEQIFTAFHQDLENRSENLRWLRGEYPDLYRALAFCQDPGEAFEVGYVAQSEGPLEQTSAPSGVTAEEISLQAAVRADAYAKRLGLEGVRYRNGFELVGQQGGRMRLDVKPEQGIWSRLVGGGIKSADLLTRELCQRINKAHFGDKLPIPMHFSYRLDAVGHDPVNAFWAAVAADLAYYEPDKVRSITRSWGLKDLDLHSDARTGTQAYVASNDDLEVICLRGTEVNLEDVLTDLAIRPVDFGDTCVSGQAPEGFLTAFKAIWPQLAPHVSAAIDAGKRLVIVGHSLGGALATLVAARLANMGLDGTQAHIYTFGAPRAVNSKAARNLTEVFGESFMRYENNNDAVTSYPPNLGRYDYAPAGQQYYLNVSGGIDKNPADADRERDQLMGRVYAAANFEALRDGLIDHRLASYIRALSLVMHVGKL